VQCVPDCPTGPLLARGGEPEKIWDVGPEEFKRGEGERSREKSLKKKVPTRPQKGPSSALKGGLRFKGEKRGLVPKELPGGKKKAWPSIKRTKLPPRKKDWTRPWKGVGFSREKRPY